MTVMNTCATCPDWDGTGECKLEKCTFNEGVCPDCEGTGVLNTDEWGDNIYCPACGASGVIE